MTFHRFRRKPGLYRDSVSLMQLAAELGDQPGVDGAAALMATPGNMAVLVEAGLPEPSDLNLKPNDLLLAVTGAEITKLDQALDWAEAELMTRRRAMQLTRDDDSIEQQTIQEATQVETAIEVAVISVPGDYAYGEALKALKAGMHVFLFSSGVELEDERRLKEFAAGRGLLMMGAECGTALINGVPYGFANEVCRGGIGLVGASGSGLQEVSCLIDAWGGGISHAIGTGGRDLDERIGGITMTAGLGLLAEDPATEVIVLISKPPAPIVAEKIVGLAADVSKPVVLCFLGQESAGFSSGPLKMADMLEDTARLAIEAIGLTVPVFAPRPSAPVSGARGYLRGLFAGGTLCTEACLLIARGLGVEVLRELSNPLPQAHLCVDLGHERHTRGRPHPIIDPVPRANLLKQVATDPSTAVVLFDIVLGHGASLEPCGPLLDVIRDIPSDARPVFVAHVCGTDSDHQDLRKQIAALEGAGVIVMPTNAAAARLAVEMLRHE